MSLAQFDIFGQEVLVAGAGRGIGKGIALAFAEAVADVADTGLSNEPVGKVATEIRAMGREVLSLTGDPTKAAEMGSVVASVLREFGRIDTLVNCVGDSIRKPVSNLPDGSEGKSEDEWNFTVDVNLTEAFQGCSAVGPHLLSRGSGSVINISSFASFRGRAGYVAYDAAKAGLMRFTESLSQEWAPYGVRVNCVAPGYFPDPHQIPVGVYPGRQEQAQNQVPLGRLGDLKEPGYLCVFPASPAAAYITGQTWAVGGGVSIKSP